jgi:hypothetical protein
VTKRRRCRRDTAYDYVREVLAKPSQYRHAMVNACKAVLTVIARESASRPANVDCLNYRSSQLPKLTVRVLVTRSEDKAQLRRDSPCVGPSLNPASISTRAISVPLGRVAAVLSGTGGPLVARLHADTDPGLVDMQKVSIAHDRHVSQ